MEGTGFIFFMTQAELVLKIRAEFANTITANSVVLRVPLPKSTTRWKYIHDIVLHTTYCWTSILTTNKDICFDRCLYLHGRQELNNVIRLTVTLMILYPLKWLFTQGICHIFLVIYSSSNSIHMVHCRVSFETELGATGQSTDFKESNKIVEWGLRKV
jgi:hypothetical protein